MFLYFFSRKWCFEYKQISPGGRWHPQWATLFIRLSAKGAANLISYRGVRRITAKVKTVICEQAPNHGSYFAYAQLIARVTLKLVCRKYPQKDEFRTKKFLNQEFLYGISSFCTLSENNSLLHGNISCFCIFLAKNGVFNTNRTPRVADSNSPQWAMLSYLSICKKGILTYAFSK